MSVRTRRLSGWLLAVMVGAALAFGASVAFSRPAQAMTCPDDGWNTFGWQPDQASCNTACWQVHGTEATARWNETTGCCSCLF